MTINKKIASDFIAEHRNDNVKTYSEDQILNYCFVLAYFCEDEGCRSNYDVDDLTAELRAWISESGNDEEALAAVLDDFTSCALEDDLSCGFNALHTSAAAVNSSDNWRSINGAVNAPFGYHWESNGKSRFGGEYKHRLVKDEQAEDQKAEVEHPEEQKAKVEQLATVPSVRFYYNGIKVGGSDQLIKVSYSTTACNDESVSIYAKGYDSNLPRDLFDVSNDTDIYTDYFCNDYAKVSPDHPLYIFVKYAAMKANAADAKRYIKYLEKRLNESNVKASGLFDYYTNELRQSKKTISDFESMKNPGQPANSDLLKIDRLHQERENARIAAEHEKELAAREKFLNERCNGLRFIENVSAELPIVAGEPVVSILWSESPKFSAWNDGELKLSVSAADFILKTFDAERHSEGRGYDKTEFLVEYINPVTGEPSTYEGRYDLGDNDGGLFEHIRSVGEYYRRSPAYGVSESDASEIVRLACWLENKSAAALTA